MVFLNVHWETFDDKSFTQVRKLAGKGKIAVSLCPAHVKERMSEEQKKWLRGILRERGFVLGQQGLTHKCAKCKDIQRIADRNQIGTDPFHENYCFWLGSKSEKEQGRLMREGMEVLERELGKKPELYTPPNHLFDLSTAKAAKKLGFKWITNRALMKMNPYEIEKMIIVPEGEPEIEGEHVYVHADRWRGDLDRVLEKEVMSFHEIRAEKKDESKVKENRKKRSLRYIIRDLTEGYGGAGYGMSEESAKRLAELLYGIKFIDEQFI